MEFKIEKNVPYPCTAPTGGRGRKSKLRTTLEGMEVGDSFVYSIADIPNPISPMIKHICDSCDNKKKFVTRTVEDGKRRVWRIK